MPTTRFTCFAVAALMAVGAAVPARAQSSGDGFLFHRPYAKIGVRGGYSVARAGSDLFEFTTENLTVNKRDFSGLSFGGAIGFTVTQRMDITLDAGYSRTKKESEFRNLIGSDSLPIQQSTAFERVPLTANLKYYLSSPGQSVGKAAWIPAKVTPWVGAGAGVMHYRFKQEGEFVDFKTNAVFPSTFDSKGWAPMLQGMAGADLTLTPLLALTGEARYLWARGELGRDFSGFNKIDLSGVSASVGLSIRL
jgi:opacity protein-like surface antigen